MTIYKPLELNRIFKHHAKEKISRIEAMGDKQVVVVLFALDDMGK